eukprot:6458347-Amphidinium_carterae.1
MGLAQYSGLISTHYGAATSRCKFWAGIVGKEWAPPRGCLQGDPLSVMLALVLTALLILELRATCPCVASWDIDAFVDDVTVTTESTADLSTVAIAFEKVLCRAGLQLNWNKSLWSSTDVRVTQRALQVGDSQLQYSDRLEVLGIDINLSGNEKDISQRDRGRFDQAKTRLVRARRIPGPVPNRANIVAAAALSLVAWNPFGPSLTPKVLAAFRAQVGQAVQGDQNWRGETAKEVFYSLICAGHRTDPMLLRLYQICVMIFEAFKQCPELIAR